MAVEKIATVERRAAGAAPATLAAVAAHLGLSRTAARDLEIQGVLSRAAGLDACRLAYLRHLRSRRSGQGQAETALRQARAREVELRTAERAHKLCETEEMIGAMEQILAKFVMKLDAVAPRATRDLEIRRQIQASINTARNEYADELAKQAAAFRATGKAAAGW
jgi:hypothetical protein